MERREKRNNRRDRTAKSRIYENVYRKGKVYVLRNIRSRQYQNTVDEGKNKKRVPQKNEKVSQN